MSYRLVEPRCEQRSEFLGIIRARLGCKLSWRACPKMEVGDPALVEAVRLTRFPWLPWNVPYSYSQSTCFTSSQSDVIALASSRCLFRVSIDA